MRSLDEAGAIWRLLHTGYVRAWSADGDQTVPAFKLPCSSIVRTGAMKEAAQQWYIRNLPPRVANAE